MGSKTLSGGWFWTLGFGGSLP